MALSDDKITHLAHVVLKDLASHVTFREDESAVLREIKRAIAAEVKVDDEVDTIVRATLASYSRRIPEGSPEWNVLYEKHFAAEMRKRHRAGIL